MANPCLAATAIANHGPSLYGLAEVAPYGAATSAL